MSSSDTPAALADLPVSAELVYRVLCASDDGATVAQLDAELHCARSTVVQALHRLEGAGLVTRRDDPQNARRDRWGVSESTTKTRF